MRADEHRSGMPRNDCVLANILSLPDYYCCADEAYNVYGPDDETFEPGIRACSINKNEAVRTKRYRITTGSGGEVVM